MWLESYKFSKTFIQCTIVTCPPNFDSSKSWLSITLSEPWTTSAIFSGKCSFAQMMLPLTSQSDSGFLSRSNFFFAEKWGCTITSGEWVETYQWWTLLIISILIAHDLSSRFIVAIANYQTFGLMMNNCHYNFICIAWRRCITKSWSLTYSFEACLACA